MRNLLTTTALIAITAISATSASATSATGDAKWKGSTPTFDAGCTFAGTDEAAMSYDESASKWTVDTAAAVEMSARDVVSLTVESEGDVLDSGVKAADAKVYYGAATSSSISGNPALSMAFSSGATSAIDVTGLDNLGYIERFTLNISGTAVMDNGSDDIKSATEYQINHVITCLQ
mgnify:CR=1 FL=1